MPPKELPGFYFDPMKNRYFPLPSRPFKRSRIIPCSSQDDKVCNKLVRNRNQATKLVKLRELHGRVVPIGRQRYGFEQTCKDMQVCHPMVWMHQDTQYIAENSLENLRMLVQTPEREKCVNVLSMGSKSGEIRFHNIGKAGFDVDCETYVPVPVWPSNAEKLRPYISPTKVCKSPAAFANLRSSISSIKKIGGFSCDDVNCNFPSSQNAIVTTLGCGETGGEVYIFNFNSTSHQRRVKRVVSFDCTLWTSACNPPGTEIAVGTNKGVALVSLETSKSSWIFHSKSDIFSQQFDNSGNVVLCGLRNGAVISVDIREKPPSRRAVRIKRPSKHGIELKGVSRRDNDIFMPSSVCSLATLASDDNYFLGSSMDGSIKLFDCRLPWRAVQSYEGHVNSHSHLQLGVNPSETHFISGGEDCCVRVWNIKTAKLLFEENVCNSIIGTVSWRQNDAVGSYKGPWLDGDESEVNQSWGVWLGSRKGIYYMHGT